MTNKTILWISVLALCLLLFSCQSTIRHRLLLNEGEAPETFSQVIPLKIERGLLVLTTKVKETELKMLLDSGAFESKVSSAKAERLGLQPVLSRSNSDTFGRSKVLDITRVENLALGDVVFKNISAGMLTYPKSAYTPCIAPDGIIGGNLLKLTNWKVDYNRSELTIKSLNQAFELPENAVAIDMETNSLSAVPKIDIRVNGKLIKDVLVDLGFNGGLVLPSESVAIDKKERLHVIDGARSGIYGTTEGQSYLANAQLNIGNLPTLNVEVEFTDNSNPKLGNKVLSNYLIVANNKNDKMYLAPQIQPKSLKPVPLEYGYLFGITDDREYWQVVYIESNLAQTQLPLKYGDKVKRVNGKTPNEQFSTHCEWFMGIREFLDTPQLTIETINGKILTLSS
ncbi:aspartyl protease family protein [Pseudoalteromonas sp. T1lg65]|uniref:aspartyl protease family protein n=1 Tax=Pseudoalteromonas sp. T1lg65 TaxID=2077101 RepID=UPI003F7A1612